MIRRRDFALGAAAAALLPLPAGAERPPLAEMIRGITGGAELRRGRVALDVPPLVENGNAVPLAVAVESPMSEADHVTAIHVVNEKNPQPQVISAALGPRAGRARLATRIKLADSQQVAAIAAMSDGTFWGATAEVVVTIAACVEDIK
jgi:sulfur-oxidizing protein SoxY